MATFYGTLQGNRGMATRMGSKASGIKVSAQSWNGSVITTLYTTLEGPKVAIEIAEGSSNYGEVVFTGTIEEFKKKLTA